MIFMLRFVIIIGHGMMITGDDPLVTRLIVILPGALPGRLNHLFEICFIEEYKPEVFMFMFNTFQYPNLIPIMIDRH